MRVFSVLIFSVGLFISCGEKEQSEDEVSPTGSLNINSGTEVMEGTIAAMQALTESQVFGDLSSEVVSEGSLKISNPNLSIAEDEAETDDYGNPLYAKDYSGDHEPAKPSEANKNCGGNGQPMDENGDEIAIGHHQFAFKRIYCLLNDKESPDVVLGSIGILKAFVCLAESQDDFEYTTEGKTIKFSIKDVFNTDIGDECVPKEVIENSKRDAGGEPFDIIDAEATGTLLPEGEKWTHSLKLKNLSTDEGDTDVRFVISPEKVAFTDGDRSASINMVDGSLRVQNFEMQYKRHSRYLVTGDVNEDGRVANVKSMQVIHAENNNGIVTVKGDAESGFTYYRVTYDCGEDDKNCDDKRAGGVWQQLGLACLDTEKCEIENAISFTNDKDAEFFIPDAEAEIEAQKNWASSHGPLCYESVTKDFLPDDGCEF